MSKTKLPLDIPAQPDDSTCGPTSLHAVYNYYNDEIDLQRVIDEVPALDAGGTLAALLGCHALQRGYAATVFTYNLTLFDPSWFTNGDDLRTKLREQARAKSQDRKLLVATEAYDRFLELGGRVLHEELTPKLIRRFLESGHPLLVGLSATYLYNTAREYGEDRLQDDDVRGVPTGHFVVVYGYDAARGEVHIADPLGDTPTYPGHYYSVNAFRLIGAILLGVLTYDANLLVIDPAPASTP